MRRRRILLTEFAIQVYSDGASQKCRGGAADGRIVWNGFDKFLWSHLRQPVKQVFSTFLGRPEVKRAVLKYLIILGKSVSISQIANS